MTKATSTVNPSTPSGMHKTGRQDWSSWPVYDNAALGLPGAYWYPVAWSSQIDAKPRSYKLLGIDIVVLRHPDGTARALEDRCPHRGVPLSYGTTEFPGTISCPYHGWTYDLKDGALVAVITDGPGSPLCGKVTVRTFPTAERLGMLWIFASRDEDQVDPPPIEDAIPSEILDNNLVYGGNIEVRTGGWRLAAENGYDEGHAKYLHRTSLWRMFRVMPVWTKTKISPTEGGWITRIQTEVHWQEDFPGLGHWSGQRWWKRGASAKILDGKPGKQPKRDPTIAALDLPGQQAIRLPGLLRIVHTRFIHYEWYVPMDESRYRYVQLMVEFKRGIAGLGFKIWYLLGARWLFHGQFSRQDEWMVNAMDCPPERLYRPDISVIAWRRLCERGAPDTRDTDDPGSDEETPPAGEGHSAARQGTND
jgi:nitrite reductase/ring-hydroxylating ferredoxin subunit